MRQLALLPDYPKFLAVLKERILHARTSAARAVNRELILLYWDIGHGIVEKQQTAGWGDAVVERLAADLRAEFPDMNGFSVANLGRMKQLYLVHSSSEFLSQAVREMKAAKSDWCRRISPAIPPARRVQRPPAYRQATGRCGTPRSPISEIIMDRKPTTSIPVDTVKQEQGLVQTIFLTPGIWFPVSPRTFFVGSNKKVVT